MIIEWQVAFPPPHENKALVSAAACHPKWSCIIHQADQLIINIYILGGVGGWVAVEDNDLRLLQHQPVYFIVMVRQTSPEHGLMNL